MSLRYEPSVGINLVYTLTGGTFTGVDNTRSRLTLGTSNAAVTFISKLSETTVYNIFISNPLRARNTVGVQYDLTTNTLVVFPAHDGTAITSTSAQIATAVQNTLGIPVTADYGGDGTGVVVVGSGVTAGGVNPSVLNNTYTHVSNSSGGLFIFDGTNEIMRAESLNAVLGSSVAWTVSLCDLNKGHRILTEYPLATGTSTSVNISLNNLLSNTRALRIVAGTTGSVSLTVSKR